MWEDQFREVILDRGYDYYLLGRVKTVKRSGDHLEGRVEGAENFYQVDLLMDEDEIEEAACDCPYALKGNFCKHMAAILFFDDEEKSICDDEEYEVNGEEKSMSDDEEYEADDEEEAILKEEDDLKDGRADRDIETILAETAPEKLRQFVKELLRDDPLIQRRFLKEMATSKLAHPLSYYKIAIRNIRYEHELNGFIDYREGMPFVHDMGDFMQREVAILIDQREYRLLIDILLYVIQMLETVHMDGSLGEYQDIVLQVEELWGEMFEQLPSPDREYAFLALLKLDKKREGVGVREDFIDQRLSEFDTKEYGQAIYDFYQKRLEQSLAKEGGYSYRVGRYASYIFQELTRMGKEEKALDFAENYLESRDLIFLLVDYLLEQKRADEAIEWLDKAAKETADRVNKISFMDRKLAIYSAKGDSEKYYEILLKKARQFKQVSFDEMHWLKQYVTTKQWEALRIELLPLLRGRTGYASFLAEEGMYDELLTLSITEVKATKAWPILVTKYPIQVLLAIKKYVLTEMVEANERRRYRELAKDLASMKEVPEGQVHAEQMVEELCEIYPRRKAMIEELRRWVLEKG
ncbi:SWIM zinc finger domain-containing protein [Atopobacter sp. AH10]|uniref:SWIM zinc finger family protein n=1 Tax=Atopobacter sp. AH10 TaxID=2315861 RepID=UPI0013149B45|nr:SWIM zinc finger family protein [Atopobacter sp. AH10]